MRATDADLARSLEDGGGFSQSMAGNPPRSGVMASDAGSERVVQGPASPSDIANFRASWAHQERFVEHPVSPVDFAGRPPNSLVTVDRSYAGGWMDDGDTYLDVSRRFPQGAQAMNALAANQQLAGYDVESGDYPTPDTPLPGMLEPNVRPVYPKYRRFDQVVGETRRRENKARLRGEQLQLPGMEG